MDGLLVDFGGTDDDRCKAFGCLSVACSRLTSFKHDCSARVSFRISVVLTVLARFGRGGVCRCNRFVGCKCSV